ncbi:MAG TPA: M15 family metallopeptidase [Candidatus Acidoferrum sp.]|nr:M15 family metallopeptidase [Candidatus Acidoferrum sp.]
MTLKLSAFSAVEHHAEIPDNFVHLREVMPDVVEDVRYYGSDNFVGERIPGYEAPRLILTLEAAQALARAQRELSYSGLALKVFDAYRPQRAVDFFGRWALDAADVRMQGRFYPSLQKHELFPQGYLVKQSSHSRGSTVDLTLIDAFSGNELDMGTEFDFFDLLSWPSSTGVGAEQRANRLLLRSVMSAAGFAGVEEEWWHFTLLQEPWPGRYFDFVIR